MKKFLGLIVVVFCILSVSACVLREFETSNSGYRYEMIEIEGMPCLIISTDLGDHRWGGVGATCDWIQWEGNQ